MKTARIVTMVGLLGLLSACNETDHETKASTLDSAPVIVDLRQRDNPQAAYTSLDEFSVPASHEIGDGMFPYEGIGWENGFVGYRLYLDGRLVSDIFGKQNSEPVLEQIGELGSYHELAPWGMDVLKVGPSLGIGGLGIMRDGEPTQFGSIPELTATIGKSDGETGTFKIVAGQIETPSGASAGFIANYSMGNKSPLTHVSVAATGDLPLATGIVMHDGAELLQSDDADGGWRYIATWGDTQSENKDGLGMALFYRADQASYGGLANSTHYVEFGQPEFEYAFLAAWELDPSGVKTKESFETLLIKELDTLAGASE